MTSPAPIAVVTGASGYLGSRICTTLDSKGWQVVSLVRYPSRSDGRACAYDLATPVSPEVREVLHSADVLVHAAYDLSLTRPVDIWRVNVDGTHRLLEVAADARIRRILVLSSMSAYEGTIVRPGLVYGERPGGMAAALRKLTRLPIVPVISGGARQYTVREDDLMMVIAALAAVETLRTKTISVAYPIPVLLPDLMRAFAAQEGRWCRFLPVPWQLVYALLRTAELLRLRLPFRADSLLGLVRTAPCMNGGEALAGLGVTLRALTFDPADRG
jgi:nucleoside-diphosphate-sugar epimerase